MQTKDLTSVALLTALLCILAPISIPTGGTSLSLATFAIYLTAFLLPPRKALTAVWLYLLLGAAGLPVFAGYTAGISRFLSPGGGYLIGYLPLVGISSFFIRRFSSRSMQLLGLALATLLLYGIGTAWLAFVTHTPFLAALPMGALVFLPLDSIKILFASMLGRKLNQYLK